MLGRLLGVFGGNGSIDGIGVVNDGGGRVTLFYKGLHYLGAQARFGGGLGYEYLLQLDEQKSLGRMRWMSVADWSSLRP